ncbi:pentatricopeptide repeat-containing protein At1g51965, mitochondrial [Asparagus officinalis]|uniref:pentatricopeptide repeat-containing protein At1g51965, mitochondrial n=1 Tax=Asparagus officinalis TaxID=4686 RepID=UPI00098E0BEE|nr:pentatricopeptide repeat-containing protein At1g51965, mitochondrial [Asparagus officinalis]
MDEDVGGDAEVGEDVDRLNIGKDGGGDGGNDQVGLNSMEVDDDTFVLGPRDVGLIEGMSKTPSIKRIVLSRSQHENVKRVGVREQQLISGPKLVINQAFLFSFFFFSSILRSPSSPDPLLDLSDYLQTLTLTLTPSESSEILKTLTSPHQALTFFHFCRSLPGFKHDCFTYNRLLSILSKSNRVDSDHIMKIVEEMERDGVRGNVSTLNILIGIVGAGEVERCLELKRKWGLRFNGYTYKCLLQAYLRCRDVEKAVRVYEEMRRRGYMLDIFAYNMLLDALSKANKVDEAYKVVADMRRKFCEPDAYTYTILIRMAGKTGKKDEVLSFLEEMIRKGHSLNLIAYNTTIEALAKNKMVDKALFLFTKMIDNNCRPNEFTYSVILDVLAAEGKLDRLHEVVEISNKYVTKSIYAFLVKTLSKLGHASEAHTLFCKMWRYHDGDKDAYISMLETLCNAEKMTEALDLLNQIHEKGISNDTVMYNMVFSALGKMKQISHISTLYEQMKQNGLPPDIFTFNILISSFGKVGLTDKATELFEEMESSDCKPDVITYNSLINCLGKNGDVDEAHMRFKEMQEKGLNPDVITYSTLIECFGKSNKVEMACRLFDEMLSVGCSPNIVTYNILLDCLEKYGKVEEAFELYSTLKQQGVTPDAITYSVLEKLEYGTHRAVRTRRQSRIAGWVVSPLR